MWVKLHDNDIFTDQMAGEQPATVQTYIYSKQQECKNTQQSGMDDINIFPKCLFVLSATDKLSVTATMFF